MNTASVSTHTHVKLPYPSQRRSLSLWVREMAGIVSKDRRRITDIPVQKTHDWVMKRWNRIHVSWYDRWTWNVSNVG